MLKMCMDHLFNDVNMIGQGSGKGKGERGQGEKNKCSEE